MNDEEAFEAVRCVCGLPIEENLPGEWIHVCTADRECWGYPFFGTRLAQPARPVSEMEKP